MDRGVGVTGIRARARETDGAGPHVGAAIQWPERARDPAAAMGLLGRI
jgi:hypothetical protein